MSNKLYISDLHIGHENVLSFDNRPFANLDEMAETIMVNWNNAVDKGDDIYILGDFFWKGKEDFAIDYLCHLNGQKHLIRGNHDKDWGSKFKKHFVEIVDYKEIQDGDRNIVLQHYPNPFYKNHYYADNKHWFMLSGHTHMTSEFYYIEFVRQNMIEELKFPCELYNVGCMTPWMGYMPRTVDEIIEGQNKWREEVNCDHRKQRGRTAPNEN